MKYGLQKVALDVKHGKRPLDSVNKLARDTVRQMAADMSEGQLNGSTRPSSLSLTVRASRFRPRYRQTRSL